MRKVQQEVGLLVARAVAGSPRLGPLREVVLAIASPACEVPHHRVATAFRDLFDQARGGLDRGAAEALLASLARLNDEHRAGVLLRELEAEREASADALLAVARGFLARGNLDASLEHARRLSS